MAGNYLIWLATAGLLASSAQAAQAPATVSLASTCPPGFELSAGNQCKLHSLYDQYNSLYSQGVGGLKTALPARRDGFSPQQIDLGRQLFFDPLLSGDQTLSCASCHQLDKNGADSRALSLGFDGKPVAVNTPTVFNAALNFRQFWDGRVKTLEEQSNVVITSPHEMGSDWRTVIERIGNDPDSRLQIALGSSGVPESFVIETTLA